MSVAEKLNSAKRKLKKIKKDQHSLVVSLQLRQKKLERVRGKLKENESLIKSLPIPAKARKRVGGEQESGPRKVMERRRYEILV